MATALGPQSANFTTTRPPRNSPVSAVDTWFQDCTSAAALDGTVFDQDFFNGLVAQLRQAVYGRAIPIVTQGDDTLLLQAITSAQVVFTASATPPVAVPASTSAGLLPPKVGDIWFDTTDGSWNCFMSDGTTQAFVQVA